VTSWALRRLLADDRHVNWVLADQALVSGVNFLTGVLLARDLGIHGFGTFTLAWMAVVVANNFQMALIVSPMMSIGPKQEAAKQAGYYGAVWTQQVTSTMLLGFLLWVGVHATAGFFPRWEISDLALPLAAALEPVW
jgi:O-antigen/teichoic acid export membrane protein